MTKPEKSKSQNSTSDISAVQQGYRQTDPITIEEVRRVWNETKPLAHDPKFDELGKKFEKMIFDLVLMAYNQQKFLPAQDYMLSLAIEDETVKKMIDEEDDTVPDPIVRLINMHVDKTFDVMLVIDQRLKNGVPFDGGEPSTKDGSSGTSSGTSHVESAEQATSSVTTKSEKREPAREILSAPSSYPTTSSDNSKILVTCQNGATSSATIKSKIAEIVTIDLVRETWKNQVSHLPHDAKLDTLSEKIQEAIFERVANQFNNKAVESHKKFIESMFRLASQDEKVRKITAGGKEIMKVGLPRKVHEMVLDHHKMMADLVDKIMNKLNNDWALAEEKDDDLLDNCAIPATSSSIPTASVKQRSKEEPQTSVPQQKVTLETLYDVWDTEMAHPFCESKFAELGKQLQNAIFWRVLRVCNQQKVGPKEDFFDLLMHLPKQNEHVKKMIAEGTQGIKSSSKLPFRIHDMVVNYISKIEEFYMKVALRIPSIRVENAGKSGFDKGAVDSPSGGVPNSLPGGVSDFSAGGVPDSSSIGVLESPPGVVPNRLSKGALDYSFEKASNSNPEPPSSAHNPTSHSQKSAEIKSVHRKKVDANFVFDVCHAEMTLPAHDPKFDKLFEELQIVMFTGATFLSNQWRKNVPEQSKYLNLMIDIARRDTIVRNVILEEKNEPISSISKLPMSVHRLVFQFYAMIPPLVKKVKKRLAAEKEEESDDEESDVESLDGGSTEDSVCHLGIKLASSFLELSKRSAVSPETSLKPCATSSLKEPMISNDISEKLGHEAKKLFKTNPKPKLKKQPSDASSSTTSMKPLATCPSVKPPRLTHQMLKLLGKTREIKARHYRPDGPYKKYRNPKRAQAPQEQEESAACKKCWRMSKRLMINRKKRRNARRRIAELERTSTDHSHCELKLDEKNKVIAELKRSCNKHLELKLKIAELEKLPEVNNKLVQKVSDLEAKLRKSQEENRQLKMEQKKNERIVKPFTSSSSSQTTPSESELPKNPPMHNDAGLAEQNVNQLQMMLKMQQDIEFVRQKMEKKDNENGDLRSKSDLLKEIEKLSKKLALAEEISKIHEQTIEDLVAEKHSPGTSEQN